MTMNRSVAFLAVAVCAVCATANALYDVADEGLWPKTWPAELEPLRKQSRTLVGPLAPEMHQYYAIRFANREEFESAWPHLVKVKSKGAPIFLVRGANFFLGQNRKSGVVVHDPPVPEAGEPAPPEAPIEGAKDARTRWKHTTYIDLVVDGAIIDLNRIPLPADTPIIDERFKDEK
jgi:hypothetical protein